MVLARPLSWSLLSLHGLRRIRDGIVGLMAANAGSRSWSYCRRLDPHPLLGALLHCSTCPRTAVEDPGHTLKRVMGIPVNVIAAAGQVLLSVVGFILYTAFKTDNEHAGLGMEG